MDKKSFDRAISAFIKAIELDPKYSYPYRNLAWLYATCPDASYRNGIRAVDLAKKAWELKKSSFTLETLGAAYAEVGRFEDAIATQRKAIERLKEEGDEESSPDYLAALKSFEDHRPWREG